MRVIGNRVLLFALMSALVAAGETYATELDPMGCELKLSNQLEHLGEKEATSAPLPELPAGAEDALESVHEIPLKAKVICPGRECTPSQLKKLTKWIFDRINIDCLVKNSAARWTLAGGLAASWIGYRIDQMWEGKPGIQNYPWELVASGLIWGPIYAEVSCRNTLRPDSATKTFRQKARPYLISIPLEAMTTWKFSIWADRYIRHKEGESRGAMDDLSLWRYAYLMGDEAGVSTLKNIYILDPLFNRKFPLLRKTVDGWVAKKILGVPTADSILAKLPGGAVDLASRVSIRLGDGIFYGYRYNWCTEEFEKDPAKASLRVLDKGAGYLFQLMHAFDQADPALMQ
jgi:hypothetical protein